MNRRAFFLGATLALTLVGQASFADPVTDDVVSQLASQGFYNITVESTLLGRMRINAARGDGQREIILNPRTGEILRDTWHRSGSTAAKPIIDDIEENGADDDGNSGPDNSGSDNSGSGSDNSGGDSGGDTSGNDHSGSGHSGSDDSGKDDSGKDDSGGDNSGSDDSGGDDSGHGGSDDRGGDDNGGKDD